MHCLAIGGGDVVCSLTVNDELSNNYGALHGGAISTIVDVVGTLALLSKDPSRAGVSIEMSQTFCAAAKVGDRIAAIRLGAEVWPQPRLHGGTHSAAAWRGGVQGGDRAARRAGAGRTRDIGGDVRACHRRRPPHQEVLVPRTPTHCLSIHGWVVQVDNSNLNTTDYERSE
eukprot:CAMPEP_0119063072 /NCGR_PEP_ID=MMETSP1178-20130426/6501_1 /TAXON_ID=33656 /ORGANISM="unid sp, Strain CCMP2000" /LENGTH=170 /DNA_ID=CAMNT_0007044403 /DNA_START=151 /DNA_END=659 /DNA_ORIENTATION=-